MDVENLAKELILKNMTPEQQMAVLDSVRQSVSNAKEVQKKKIGENVDLVVQALKKIESDIRDRFDAVGNSIEKRVLSIQDGRDGADGKDGRDGKDGKSGRDGLKGDRGVDGQAGRDGVDGVDGISVVNAQIDFDGSLVITLSDGRELNVGEVVSADVAEKIKVISTMSTNAAIAIKDEGSSITSSVKTINFVGATVTATNSGDDVTVNVSAGTGTVTSVAATVPTFLSVTGSPVTTTGTLAISLSGTALPVANGGTGQTSYTDGQLLIGNTTGNTLTKTTLSAGSGISITNGAGSISIAATGSGTVTSVTGTSPVASSGGATPAISLEANYGDTLNPYASKTAKFVLAAPNASAGVPTFRAIVASDIPTLNQSTTGSAATLTTTRAIYGNNFDGSAALTQIIASTYGGTGNGFTKFTGATTSEKTYTLPNANSTIVVQGGALGTPTSGTLTNCTFPTLNQNTTGSAATVTTTINSGVVATTQTAGDNSTKVATTAYVNAITGTNGITGFKNRIINSAMVIDQRNAGASVATTVTGTPTYTLDRFAYQSSQASKYTVQQNAAAVTPPTGFLNYLGVTSTSAYSVLTGDYFLLRQPIEGFNTADLGFGTASASTVTLSFWVRSSLTGTFGGSLGNGSRSYPFSYTISVANTWEQKSITIAGDTSGTWVGATNGTGMILAFSLGMGSTYSTTAGAWAAGNFLSATGATSVVGTNGATFYITGVQLEKGSTATSFDYRPYGTELALCQRYYETSDGLVINSAWATIINAIYWKVTKRTSPSTITTTVSAGSGAVFSSVGSGVTLVYQSSTNSAAAAATVTASSEL